MGFHELAHHLFDIGCRLLHPVRHLHAQLRVCWIQWCCHGIVWWKISRNHLPSLRIDKNSASQGGGVGTQRTVGRYIVRRDAGHGMFVHSVWYVVTILSNVTRLDD